MIRFVLLIASATFATLNAASDSLNLAEVPGDWNNKTCPAVEELIRRKRGVLLPGQECLHGTSWKNGCNDCFCYNGVPACTVKLCHIPSSVTQRQCVHGTIWKSSCNDCFCHDGIPACTVKTCRPFLPNGIGVNGNCVHGAVWKNDCNDCFCHLGLAACTVKLCNIPGRNNSSRRSVISYWNPTLLFHVGQNQNNHCVHGTSWKNDCNDCFCSNGIPTCTLKLCHVEGLHVGQCIEGSSWKHDCNNCYCHHGVPACTLRSCPLQAPKGVVLSNNKCVSGATWKDDCNDCFCSSTGVASCTQKLCPPYASTTDASSCIIGTVWKEYCNDCSCPTGVPICTVKQCTSTTSTAFGSSQFN